MCSFIRDVSCEKPGLTWLWCSWNFLDHYSGCHCRINYQFSFRMSFSLLKKQCMILCRIFLWPRYPWELFHWNRSWRSSPSPPKTMAWSGDFSSRRWMTACSHLTSKRSWSGRTPRMGSTRSKGATTAPSSRSHSHCIRFCLRLHSSHNKKHTVVILHQKEETSCPVGVV